MATPAQQAPRRRRKSSILSEAPLGAVSSANTETPQKPSARRKAQTALRHYHRLCAQHTWVLPLTLILLTLLAYALSPGAHNPLHAALFLSYANPPLHERTHTLPARLGPVTQYGQGPKDLAFVAFYTVVLSFTREFLMQRVVRPVALACGLRRPAKLARFMEQMYTALYFGVAGPVGLYVMSRTPVWYFDVMGMYEGFPHRAHEACFKAYYLLQGAYWAQQALVLVLRQEKPRKDFRELVVHHVVTLSLIALSFRFHFTYMGVAVYVTHDISDFFLAVSASPPPPLPTPNLTPARPPNASTTSTRPSQHRASSSSSACGPTHATCCVCACCTASRPWARPCRRSCTSRPSTPSPPSAPSPSTGPTTSTSSGSARPSPSCSWAPCRRSISSGSF